MQYLGHPLIVDKLYGNREEFFLSEIKHKYRYGKDEDELPLISRQTLHSHQIQLTKPSTNEQLILNASLPKDLKALRNQLAKTIKGK
jgi:23S rRNA-/tRNA-specific pseudouridylate synthase